METQKAALNYERSCSQHQAAKVAVAHAEQKLASTPTEHKTLDPTWQEMLNRTIKKVRYTTVELFPLVYHISRYFYNSIIKYSIK